MDFESLTERAAWSQPVHASEQIFFSDKIMTILLELDDFCRPCRGYRIESSVSLNITLR